MPPHENEKVDLRRLDLGDRIVHGAMRDVVAALGETVAQLGGVRRVDQLDLQSALLIIALRLGRDLRQIGHARENDDLERRLRHGAMTRSDGRDRDRRRANQCFGYCSRSH